MRRSTVIILLLIIMCAWIAPVHAQEGFTPEEQEALDTVRAALESLFNANTYTADMTQKTIQNISVDYDSQSIQMDQTMTSTGAFQIEKMPENQYDNQQISMTQTIESTISGAQSSDQTIGPMVTNIIVYDDHIYLKMDLPAELQGYIPRGWQDVTEGADAFPGMDLINIDGILGLGKLAGPDYVTNLFNAVLTITILEPETVGGRAANHYRLALDPQLALETIGAANMEQMFNANQSPFDIAGLIELMFTDEDTIYDVDLLIFADDQTLYTLSVRIFMDILIPPDLMRDLSLQGAEMTFKQDITQIMQISGIDVPVSIQAPDLRD